jgi:Tfp pilus assembly protein PilF
MLLLALAGIDALSSDVLETRRMMHLTYKRIAEGLVIAALMSLTSGVFGQNAASGPKETVLLMASGTVEVAPPGTSNYSVAHPNQVLHVGDQIRTGKNSRATVRLSNLSVIRVYELTTMAIRPPTKAEQNAAIELKSGATYFFNRDKPNETQFETPSSSGAIRGTEFNLSVDDNGRTELALLDGQVLLNNAHGSLQVDSGERAVVDKDQAPQKSPLLNAINIIQWALYYPAILDPDELTLGDDAKQALATSLTAYRSGDLLEALAQYPAGREPASESERVYKAALLLAVGNVDGAQSLLGQSFQETVTAGLADALKEMIASVKGQTWNRTAPRTMATEWMAGSYQAQSQRDLVKAREMAQSAAAKAPGFGFAQERVAEMEFSFGRTDAALAALKKSLEVSPRNAQALALNGFALTAQNKMAAAGEYFEKAIATDGSLANGWLGRGLVRIRKNQVQAGRQDLETAAALEPNRAFLRSYLGKAWSMDEPFRYTWNTHLATRELALAMRLDPNDPTAWLYSALLNDQRNSINQAIDDLEHSEALNNNRAVFRSKFSLDQDAAVRSANLALIYEDAGLSDVATREATKAVHDDYANYSAHLFLSETYDALQDPTKENLRYQTPWEDELLVANLLAPVGAGVLSQNVSQQEYSKMFESDREGISSQTTYFSRGAWMENASQYGTVGDFAYSLDAYEYSDPGWRPNNDINNSDFDAKLKYQFTPKDTAFLEVERSELDVGDVFEHYNYKTPEANDNTGARPGYDPTLREQEYQDPNILLGYHRDWGTGNHDLILYRSLQDRFTDSDGDYAAPYYFPPPFTPGTYPVAGNGLSTLSRTLVLNSIELQHIYQSDWQSIIAGGRYQHEGMDSSSAMAEPFTGTPLPALSNVRGDFERVSFYGYYQLHPVDSLHLTAGATYDWERFPLNINIPPLSSQEDERGRLSPKLGVDWTAPDGTRLRAAYTRSMSGLVNDSSTLIEPSEVAGFNQAFRSLIPESAGGYGTPPATRFETWGLGADHKFPTGTYVDIEGQLLTSRGNQLIGAWNSPIPLAPTSVSDLPQTQYFQEKDAFASVSQLIGKELSVGARYTLTSVDLSADVTVPAGTLDPQIYNQHENSTLNELSLFANFAAPCGFFSSLQGNYWHQFNTLAGEGDDGFWQMNLYAGYRFPRRHVELSVGLLNITSQDYHIDPVTYFLEQAHSRTLVASMKFNF